MIKSKYSIQVILLLFALTTASCKMNTNEGATGETTQEALATENSEDDLIDDYGDPIILGVQTRAAIEAAPYDRWFTESYKMHTLDTVTLNTVKGNLAQTDITLFMGTWCEDSQRETPAFYKMLDLAGIDSDTVKLITVSEDKDTPEGLEKGQNITNVPTIIFSKDGKELGRIVEYPLESLEKDMAKILTGEDYKHAYAE